MRIFRLPFLNWLIFNAIAFYYLDTKNSLSWNFSGWMGILAILVALESFGWIAASLYYFYRYKTSPNPIVQATALITEGPFTLLFTNFFIMGGLATLKRGLFLPAQTQVLPPQQAFLGYVFQQWLYLVFLLAHVPRQY